MTNDKLGFVQIKILNLRKETAKKMKDKCPNETKYLRYVSEKEPESRTYKGLRGDPRTAGQRWAVLASPVRNQCSEVAVEGVMRAL